MDKKYKIIKRNFKKPWGEIDIIAKSPDKTLVFIEVKALKQLEQLDQPIREPGQLAVDNPATYMAGYVDELTPEENLTSAKYKKLCRICEFFSRSSPKLIDENKGWRIDLITLTIQEKSCIVKHYKNI